MGVPLGIPPGPDDPVISRVAPEECVFYTTWAASANADRRSKNQAEQMLAEPEVRLFVEHLEKWIRHAVNQAAPDREVNNLSDATYDTLLMVLRHQTAMFVSDVKVKGKRVSAKGGMVVALGADAPFVRRLFHQHVRSFFINLNAESIETALFHGEKWYRVRTTANFPSMLVGVKDSYLVVAVGEESPDAILERMRGPVPNWLVEARQFASFERTAGLTYINLRRLRDAGAASGDANRQKLHESLGLTQVPWVMSASGFVGADVVTRTILPIEGRPRGLLRAATGRGLKREDLAAIPRDATMALAMRLDLQRTWDAIQQPAKPKARDDEVAVKISDIAQPEGAAGSLPPDAFKSLGDRWCFYNSPKEGGMVLTGLTGVVPINDRQHFSKHYEVLTRLATQALPPDDGSGNARVRRVPFADGEIHYAGMGDMGLAPAWFAGEKQLVVALTPQSVKAYLSRPAPESTIADVPEVAAELAGLNMISGKGPLLAIGYLDAPRVFETVYPLLMIAAPSYLGASGMIEGRRDMSVFPSLPSVSRHLRPGIATLRRTKLGLELTSRGSMPGFGLAAPVMFLAWDSEWLNLVFGSPEDNGPPMPIPVAVPAGPAPPPLPPGPPAILPQR
jgi:hypothetical protein